ncbi:3-oxoacyl-ACP synthase [Actinoplanes sp. TBRC 11911]|uniref:3-oxoacyl-[acyl-carrier-protein] synthase III C-terminal domain-containing protein n=1 Tax=Actinoplanes sp. TBRC 11911 TaxID=2729386 RepID=UPI00145E2B7C|nr:3-oxoacyl-[acyl-carrier-protein] synthase III C-terminal domain-containing protein [Actinoplanes sp. TBRC 11911]NMO53356.1 3-oxoacyl-ACP synthase [Actinoplanes sp. TBRC 11911]
MTSLAAVSTYLPSHRESVHDYLRGFAMSDREIRIYKQYYGFSEIRRDPGRTMAEQLIAAGRMLPGLDEQRENIRYVIQARTMQVAAPYPADPLHEARAALGLTNAMAFSLSQQACASALMAVEIAGRLLAEDDEPDALALVFVGEKTFTSDAAVLGVTAVMGEGVAAVLVRGSDVRDRVLGFASRIHGRYHKGPRMTDEDHEEWAGLYIDALAEVITTALDRAGLTARDIDLILPHHVNRLSWYKLLKAMGIDDKKRLYTENLPTVGHCFGADPFLNYQTALASGVLQPGDRYVMTAVGLGATFSAMVFEH